MKVRPHPRGDDRERITRARQAAEALFTAKPPVRTPAAQQTAPADPSARRPRVLPISPASVQHGESKSPVVPAPPTVEIPPSQVARIRDLGEVRHEGYPSGTALWGFCQRDRAPSRQSLTPLGPALAAVPTRRPCQNRHLARGHPDAQTVRREGARRKRHARRGACGAG